MFRRVVISVVMVVLSTQYAAAGKLHVGTFDVDASPPIGSPLAYVPTKEITLPLSCRGVVLIGDDRPIVLCAVDWIGIANDSQKEFRQALATAVHTTVERVAVHTLHQHDAPRCNLSVDRLAAEYGIEDRPFNAAFSREVVARAAAAAKQAAEQAKAATHLGLGQAKIEQVASNRRILGPDGKVQYTRWTACRDPKVRAMPVGTIDPYVKMISLWNGDEALAVLTYYATHPQSYYRTGGANPDFPGMARNMRQQATGVLHVHFNGAGGDVTAGKWNDGSPENRQILADRVALGMSQAWEATKKTPISSEDLGWQSLPVALPVAPHLDERQLLAQLEDKTAKAGSRISAAGNLIWLRRCRKGDKIDIPCLRLGTARVLHLPGELLVGYQLAAQKMRPDLFVAMAAYGEYAPGYICMEAAYSEGGYEASPGASLVAPSVEGVLMETMRRLLR